MINKNNDKMINDKIMINKTIRVKVKQKKERKTQQIDKMKKK